MSTADSAEAAGPLLRSHLRPSAAGVVKLLIAIAILAYVVLRVWTLDLTGDEPPARNPYADTALGTWFEGQAQPLFYWIGTLFVDVFRLDIQLGYRLPSVLGLVLYMVAAYFLARRFRPPWLANLGFASLMANAYMLDFFSIARPYALAVGLCAVSFLLLVRATEAQEDRRFYRNACLCIWAASLGVASNLAFMHYYGGLMILLALLSVPRVLRENQGQSQGGGWSRFCRWMARNQYLMANGLALFLLYLHRIVLLQRAQTLFMGGNKGYVQDSVTSLLVQTFYDVRVSEATVERVAYGLAALSVAIAVRSIAVAGRTRIISPACLFSALLLLHVFISYMLHLLFGVLFVHDRGVLVLYPLFVAQVFAWAAAERVRPLAITVGCAAGAALLGLCLPSMNLTHTSGWRQMSQNRLMLADIAARRGNSSERVVLGVSDGVKPQLERYKKAMGYDWLDWYSIDMNRRFTGQYSIHPQTRFLYIHQPDGQLPWGLGPLPMKPVSGKDYSISRCRLYEMESTAKLEALLRPAVTNSP